jgi:hypothetical protein
LLVGQTPSKGLLHTDTKASTIIQTLAIVVTEYLLIHVFVQVERANSNIGSIETTLQKGPEVFDTVGVNVCPYIPVNVIDDLMVVGFVCNEGIG